MLWRPGDGSSAEEHIRTALRIDSQDAWAHDYLGVVLRWTDRDQEAEQEFRTAIRLWPELPLFHCHLGDALVRLGRTRDCEHSYKEAPLT